MRQILLLALIALVLALPIVALAQKPDVPSTPEPAAASTDAPLPPTAKPAPPPTAEPPTDAPSPPAVATPEPAKPPGEPTPTGKPAVLTPTPDKVAAGSTPTPKPVVLTPLPTKPVVEPTPTSKPLAPTPTATGKAVSPPTPAVGTGSPAVPTSNSPGGETGTGSGELPVTGQATGANSTPNTDRLPLALQWASWPAESAGADIVAGRVFDDSNNNGSLDPGEAGLPGVPVTLDGHVVAATDSGGRFTLPLVPGTLLAILPPQDWQWNGAPVPAEASPGDVTFPLHRVSLSPTTTAVTGGMAAGSLALLALAGGLVFNSLAALSQAAAVRGMERTYRRQKTQEFELARANEMADHLVYLRRQLSEMGNPEPWSDIVAQLLADAGLGADWIASLCVKDVSATPCPQVTFTGLGGNYLVLTTQPDQVKQWRDRVIPLDAGLSCFARVEAQALWEHLARGVTSSFTLPRDAEWYLVITRARHKPLVAARSRKRALLATAAGWWDTVIRKTRITS